MVTEIIIDTIHAGFRQVKFPVILMNKILWCDITVVLVEYIVQEVQPISEQLYCSYNKVLH